MNFFHRVSFLFTLFLLAFPGQVGASLACVDVFLTIPVPSDGPLSNLKNSARLWSLWESEDQAQSSQPYSFDEIFGRQLQFFPTLQNDKPVRAIDITHLDINRAKATVISSSEGHPMQSLSFGLSPRDEVNAPSFMKGVFELEVVEIETPVDLHFLSVSEFQRGVWQSFRSEISSFSEASYFQFIDELERGGIHLDWDQRNDIHGLYSHGGNSNHAATYKNHLLDMLNIANHNGSPLFILDSPLAQTSDGRLLLQGHAKTLFLLHQFGVLEDVFIARTPDGQSFISLPFHRYSWASTMRIKDFPDVFYNDAIFNADQLASLHGVISKMEEASVPFFQQSFDISRSPDAHFFVGGLVDILIKSPESAMIFDLWTLDKFSASQVDRFINGDPYRYERTSPRFSLDYHVSEGREKTTDLFGEPFHVSDAALSGYNPNIVGPASFGNLLRKFLILYSEAGQAIEFLESLMAQGDYKSFFSLIHILDVHASDVSADVRNHTRQIIDHFQFFSDPKQLAFEPKDVKWINGQVRRTHAKKHAHELGVSREVYSAAALQFFQESQPGDLFFQRRDGSIMKYNTETYEFGIATSVGQVISYFRFDVEINGEHTDLPSYLGDNLNR